MQDGDACGVGMGDARGVEGGDTCECILLCAIASNELCFEGGGSVWAGGRVSRALTSELDAGMALGSPQLLKQCNAFHALRRQAGATLSTGLRKLHHASWPVRARMLATCDSKTLLQRGERRLGSLTEPVAASGAGGKRPSSPYKTPNLRASADSSLLQDSQLRTTSSPDLCVPRAHHAEPTMTPVLISGMGTGAMSRLSPCAGGSLTFCLSPSAGRLPNLSPSLSPSLSSSPEDGGTGQALLHNQSAANDRNDTAKHLPCQKSPVVLPVTPILDSPTPELRLPPVDVDDDAFSGSIVRADECVDQARRGGSRLEIRGRAGFRSSGRRVSFGVLRGEMQVGEAWCEDEDAGGEVGGESDDDNVPLRPCARSTESLKRQRAAQLSEILRKTSGKEIGELLKQVTRVLKA